MQGSNGSWFYSPQFTGNLQSGNTAGAIQLGSSPQKTSLKVVQGSSPNLQPTANPMNYADPVANAGGVDTGFTGGPTAAQIAAQEAAARAAENARQAGILRGDITGLVNRIKDIFNSRYGQVDAAAGEQVGKLNDRFANESSDITRQVTGENEKLGAAHASAGTYDSSYRGNNVDTVTRAGEGQIRDLGTELSDNTSKIGSWVATQKQGFDAEKNAHDLLLSRIAESTDPGELTGIRNSLDSKIATLQAGNADNNTQAQNASALASIAPSNIRAQKLQTTLSQIVAGNADKGSKAAIGAKLIESANLAPEDAQKLLSAFQSDISNPDKQKTA